MDGKLIEVDAFIEGTIAGLPVIDLGEVKCNLTLSEVERFLELAERIRDTHAEFGESELRIMFRSSGKSVPANTRVPDDIFVDP